ncbi:MAG: hypothetical protein JWM42_891 [Burkholderia sp.]|nr:hypothetical protein [Burkholderia sp.]
MKVRIYLALMVMAILVPVIVFPAAALNMLLRAEREAALRGARETARATAVAVDRELDNARTALRLLGTSRYLAQEDWEGFYGQGSVAQADKGTWVTLLEPDGRQVINTDLPFGTPLAPVTYPALLRQQMKAEKPVVSDLLTDPVDGQHLIDARKTDIDHGDIGLLRERDTHTRSPIGSLMHVITAKREDGRQRLAAAAPWVVFSAPTGVASNGSRTVHVLP